jgi:hypothetical protein
MNGLSLELLALASLLACLCAAQQSVVFTAVSFPPCVPAFTVRRVALMYGIPQLRVEMISASGCNVSFYFTDTDGSQNDPFVSAAALSFYFSTLQQYALQNFTLIEFLSYVGPAPASPPPLPSNIPTPVPVTAPSFVATFPSAIACASFPGKLAALLQILPSRILFQTSPNAACSSQAILQFSFAKRINGDLVTIADIFFALKGIAQSQETVENSLGASSLTIPPSSALPDASQFAVGNESRVVFSVSSPNFSVIGEFLRNALSPGPLSLLWVTPQNETTFSSSDSSFLSCVYPSWQQSPTGSTGKSFPLLWICCGLTLLAFAGTCIVVSKRPQIGSADASSADLAERLRQNSPNRPATEHAPPTGDKRTLQVMKQEFDMD